MDYSFVEVATVKALRQDLLTLQRERNDLMGQRASLTRLLKASRKAPKYGRAHDIEQTLTMVNRRLEEVNTRVQYVQREMKFSRVVQEETALTRLNSQLGNWLFRMLGGDVENEI